MTIKLNKNSYNLLHKLRDKKPAHKKVSWEGKTLGHKVSDKVTNIVGSWSFIIAQSIILFFWILVNLWAWMEAWDPYPFILLNLVLSFQAAFTAPIIMMSQNRQNEMDRKRAENDYHINVKAELEIEHLQEKIDELRNKEIKQILDALELLKKKVK